MPHNMTAFVAQFNYAAVFQNAIRVAIIIVVALVLWVAIRLMLAKLTGRMVKRASATGAGVHGAEQRAKTVFGLIQRLTAAFYWTLVVLTLLSQIGVNVGALVAGAGIVGLALSFGAQGLVKDYISGFFIVLEGQVSVGDIAIINGTWGEVESIKFRTTVLRSMDGLVHVFRNASISSLANATKDWGGYVFKLHIAYREDTDRVVDVLKRVGAQMKADATFGREMLADMEIHGVNELTDSSVVIRGRFRTTPMNQWAIGREFLGRVKRTFDNEGIRIAQPRQVLSFDEASMPSRFDPGEDTRT